MNKLLGFAVVVLMAVIALGVFSSVNEGRFRTACVEAGGLPYMHTGIKRCLRAETIPVRP